ncbi:hypothetical protein Tco_1092225 [Tanacetum coccineum]|uniref:Uncharacterized protein n=1 Tax=Tanacetum coccineum TaxID=301880 RepID=A0ABQ5I984_9ASTR
MLETEIDDNTIPYHQYLLDTEAQNVPTEKKILSEKKDLVDSLSNEIVLFKECYNKLQEMVLQRFKHANTYYSYASKNTKAATADLHKDRPSHHPVRIWIVKRLGTTRVKTSNSATPATPFVRKSRPPSQVLTSLRNVNAVFPQFEGIIKERTTQKPDYVSEWCFDYAKQFVEQQLIFDELEGGSRTNVVLDNKNLTIEKKNLLIKNDCLIAECLEKDICSIVLSSDIVVPPSLNCLCEDL